MIFDLIDRKIKDMKSLRRLELIKENHKQQNATDNKYSTLVKRVSEFSRAVEYAHDNLDFSAVDIIRPDMLSLLGHLKDAVSGGYADKEAVLKAESDFKAVQNVAKKEWGKHFSGYTFRIINTLKVISGIDAERINGCIAEIKAAENWTVDVSALVKLKTAVENADSLIENLGMDQETVEFLTKMTSGRATIADLNENVLNWIRKEGLEPKIKLSFTSGKGISNRL